MAWSPRGPQPGNHSELEANGSSVQGNEDDELFPQHRGL